MMGALGMRKVVSTIGFGVLLLLLTTGFPGCKTGAPPDGAARPASALANEPDVTFKDLQGQDVRLDSLKGKVVLLNFWATWCAPCRAEIPILILLQQKYSSKGFTLLGAAMDDEGKKVVEPYVRSTQFDVGGHSMTMNYPIVLGNDDIAMKFGGLLGMPTSFLISRDGKIVKKYMGAVNEDQIVKDVEAQL
jgi:thiol-disulfide isomerase/thioredoxin